MAEFQRESKTFSQVLNFTRGSTGTYFDASGVLQTAAVDEPRFTHDPESLAAQGLLIEEQRTNLLLWSEAFDDAAWIKDGLTLATNSASAPDGSLAAAKITETATNEPHYIRQPLSFTQGTRYTLSVSVKPAEKSQVWLYIRRTSTEGFVAFDAIDGSIVFISNPDGDIEYTSESEGDGWYRFSVSVVVDSTEVAGAGVGLYDGGITYTGDGTSGIYIWGAQLEEGSFPTSYIKTEGSQVTRSADNCSRTLGSEFNASEGRIEVTATANAGDTVIALGTESIVADVDTEKTYTLTYNADPSATTMDILPGATGTAKSVKYSPRETA